MTKNERVRMGVQEFNSILEDIRDCEAHLKGKAVPKNLQDIIDHAAKRAVLLRRENLYDRLKAAGLDLEV